MHHSKKRSVIRCTIALAILALSAFARAGESRRTMRYTSRSQEAAVDWQREVRAKLFDAMKMNDLVATGRTVPLEPKITSSQDKEKYRLEEIELSSTPGRRIKTVVTHPRPEQATCPAVVCIHGHGGNRHRVYDMNTAYRGFAAELAERGYITISVDVGQHKIFEANRTLMGERLWDLMRCVDYLELSPRIDKSRIGCAGLSLGGEMAMWLGAMDERMAATVSAGFLTKMDQMESGHCMCWKFPGLRELVDFADIYSLTAPRALRCQNGLKEPPSQFPVPLAREALEEIKLIYTDFRKPENAALVAHEGGHVVDVPSLLAFFENEFAGQ